MSRAELEKFAREALSSAKLAFDNAFHDAGDFDVFNRSLSQGYREVRDHSIIPSLSFSPMQETRIKNGTLVPTFSAQAKEIDYRSMLIVPSIRLRQAAADDLPRDFPTIKQSIVHVDTYSSGGTGFWTEDGLVATNWHVVQSDYGGIFRLTHADGTKSKGRLVAQSVLDDVALLQSDRIPRSSFRLPFGSTSALTRGDSVYAAGHPDGFPFPTISQGTYQELAGMPKVNVTRGNKKMSLESHDLEFRMTSWSGFSGSPIINDNAAIGLLARGSRLGAFGPTAEHMRAVSEVLRKDGPPAKGWLNIYTNSRVLDGGLQVDVLRTKSTLPGLAARAEARSLRGE